MAFPGHPSLLAIAPNRRKAPKQLRPLRAPTSWWKRDAQQGRINQERRSSTAQALPRPTMYLPRQLKMPKSGKHLAHQGGTHLMSHQHSPTASKRRLQRHNPQHRPAPTRAHTTSQFPSNSIIPMTLRMPLRRDGLKPTTKGRVIAATGPQQLTDSEAKAAAADLRAITCLHAEKHAMRFAPFISTGQSSTNSARHNGKPAPTNIEKWCEVQTDPKVWLDAIGLQALSEKTGAVLVVWSKPPMDGPEPPLPPNLAPALLVVQGKSRC